MAQTNSARGAQCTATTLIGNVNDYEFLDGETLTVDENNIVTLTVRFLKSEGQIINTLKKIPSWNSFGPFDLDSYSAEALNDSSKKFIVTAVYKTLDLTTREGDLNDEYGIVENMDYDYSEEPLEAHPNIVAIAKKYGGVPRPDGTYDFPAKIPQGATTNTKASGLGFGGSGAEVNPLYGMKTYPALQARYSKSFGTKLNWAKYVGSAGKITDGIPNSRLDNSLGAEKKGRNWLQLPPKIQKEGAFYRVSVEYLLSAPGKRWPTDVFENV
jgi:hypothetical protein